MAKLAMPKPAVPSIADEARQEGASQEIQLMAALEASQQRYEATSKAILSRLDALERSLTQKNALVEAKVGEALENGIAAKLETLAGRFREEMQEASDKAREAWLLSAVSSIVAIALVVVFLGLSVAVFWRLGNIGDSVDGLREPVTAINNWVWQQTQRQ